MDVITVNVSHYVLKPTLQMYEEENNHLEAGLGKEKKEENINQYH